ncbi:UNVERIFIED_CONTAM: protein ILITYHIA [Sesamum calycinum]|uniref:Protein ILITYHIA n=1 Tax=Sesamum calycinum TaxID=2727403 RepID=A0AAW2L4J5_9LAMI
MHAPPMGFGPNTSTMKYCGPRPFGGPLGLGNHYKQGSRCHGLEVWVALTTSFTDHLNSCWTVELVFSGCELPLPIKPCTGHGKAFKFQSLTGSYRLLQWSCLLLIYSQFASLSKNALCRVAQAQASVLHIVMQGPSRLRRACSRTFFSLFTKSPDIYKTYMEELKDGRIPYKDSPELIHLMLDYLSSNPASFDKWKDVFLDIYVKAVLNAREKPTKALSEAFIPLFIRLSHEDFKNTILPTSVKMLKRNPEVVLESIGVLLESSNLDLSKYAIEILSVVLTQARHADEGRRLAALAIVRCLSQKSSSPDAVEAMFSAIRSVMGGSEGRLTFPYQRVGMVNALREISNAPEGKYFSSLSPTICGFLLSCYKDDGNEEVKLVTLSCIASWAVKSADAISPDLVTFFASGLKEKEALRRGCLRCLRLICKNTDAVLQLMSKQVLAGWLRFCALTILALLDFSYILVYICGSRGTIPFQFSCFSYLQFPLDETVSKEKIWQLILQNEPTILPISLTSKLSIEDLMACTDLVEVLVVDYTQRLLENYLPEHSCSFICFSLCHPNWDIRKAAHGTARKILVASPLLSEAILLEFSSYLSVVGEKTTLLKMRAVGRVNKAAEVVQSDTENMIDSQVPFLPPVEVLVKALTVIASAVSASAPDACMQLLFCSHHPYIVGTGKKNAVWKRVQKCLQKLGFDVIGLVTRNVAELCKYFINLPDRIAHDTLSDTDIQIFRTPEGMLSTEQGVYIAESVVSKNVRQAKGRFRVYGGDDTMDQVSSNHSVVNLNHSTRRDVPNKEVAGAGKKDAGKSMKKAGKSFSFTNLGLTSLPFSPLLAYMSLYSRILMLTEKTKTAKEEARELQLKEEGRIRERVMSIQQNISLMLKALGEMAIANPIFTHSQLPSSVKYVNPFLRSPIVGDAAFETLVKLSKCTIDPLSNWALEIATALRLIATEETSILWELFPSIGEEEDNGTPSLGLFERLVSGLTSSCKSGPLPVDSFTFIFPVIERILLSPKKTGLHDDVLQILFLHMDPILPLPRIRMLSVLYHVLGVVPAYQTSIGPALNELCLGLLPDEVAPALSGIYAKDIHVRMACLNAVKCIPAVSNCSIPQNVEVATSIWLALHDIEKSVAEVAEDVWDSYRYEFGTDYSGLFKALSHVNYNVRVAAAEALAAALDENPDSIQESLSTLFSLYLRDVGFAEENIDAGWLGRQGIALALLSVADVLRTKDLPVVMTFLISRALADPNSDVRGRMVDAGIMIIDKHGRDNVSLLFPIFENYLNKKASDEEKYDSVREGVVIFTGALAKHLSKGDPKVHAVVEKLLDVLNTPSETVQRAVSSCLSPLMQSKQEEAAALISRLLDQLMKSDKYGERRGAAFGLAGVVKGFGISCLKKYNVVTALRDGLSDRNSAKSREGALLAFECFCEKLGRLFEPYVIQMLPLLLVSFSDQVVAVREAAEGAARAMMSKLSAQGVKLVLPSLLKGLEDKAWRTKQSSVQLLGAMAYCAPQQLSQCLPKIVPKLTEVLTDTHPKVQSAGQTALQQVGSVIKNPEIAALVPTLLMGLTDPNDYTKYSLDILLQTTFINTVDAPSLALLVPIVHRGLRERGAETKKKAAQIVGNMCSLVTEPKDMIPYISLLLPEVKKVLVDPIPEVRSVAARAIGSLIRGMGEENFPDLVPWLLDTLKSDGSNVERSGAAQGLSEVLAALGAQYFEDILPDIIRNCSHPKASVRDGYLTLFKYLPRSLGVQFQNYLQQVLPAILDGLADENESVRDAALSAGHVLVEHYATTSLPLLLPAVEDGIFNDNWRIRQSSVELLGDLLFKVAGTSGKALLEGGSDDEGASTEAQGRAIIEVLGREKRNEVLAALYMVRTDVSITVRQAALHVWKTIVANTPKTLKEIMPVLMNTLITSLASSSSERRQGGPVLIPGFALPKALQPVLPIFLQGLISGSAELREQAALGLGELIEVTSEKALKEFVIPITGPLIRIIGDRFPWQVKSAILSTLSIMIQKGGIALKPFLPQLQTTFVKCLQDNTRTVRSSAAFALGKLSALSTRIDPLVGDLLSGLQASDLAIREAILTALEGVIKNAGKSLSSAVITRVHTQLNDIIYSEDDQIRSSAASILGILLQVNGILGNAQTSEVLMGVTDSASSSTWTTRHGSILAISSMLRHNAAIVCASPLFTSIIECLKGSMKDEKFPVRESSVRALGRLFLYQIRNDPSNTAAHVATLNYLVLAMQDDSSEVRRRALNALKAVAKANPQGLIIHTSLFGPALAECLKDGSTPVRLAAERCALHSFQLSKGTEYVQAAQKYITVWMLEEYQNSQNTGTQSEILFLYKRFWNHEIYG